MIDKENATLLRELLDVGRQMAETRALEPLLTYAVDVTLELLDARAGFLILRDSKGKLDFSVARDRRGNDIEDPESQISKTILFRVIDEMKPQRIASAMGDKQFGDAFSVKGLSLKSILCVPLISRGSAIGAIYLENRNEYDLFTEADVDPLQYLAGHAAVCIQNAILNEQLEAQANRMDELTHLVMNGETPPDVIQTILEKERSHILYNFIRDASHQFRTPLTVIKTSTDVLKRKIDPALYGSYLDRIHNQVNIVVKLVDSLNLLAKLDADTRPEFTKTNIVPMIKDLWDVLSQRAAIKQIEMLHSVPDYAVYLAIIPDYIQQALRQLLENAINYTDSGGQINIDLIDDAELVRVIVSDTGSGIAPDDLSRVLERFYRADKAGTTHGLGLGLSIAGRIMSIHGGNIEMDSSEQGTKVTLIFPKFR